MFVSTKVIVRRHVYMYVYVELCFDAFVKELSNDSPNVRPVSLFIPVAIFLEIKSGDILKQTSADLLTGDTSRLWISADYCKSVTAGYLNNCHSADYRGSNPFGNTLPWAIHVHI